MNRTPEYVQYVQGKKLSCQRYRVYKVSDLMWNPPRQRAAVASENELVTVRNSRHIQEVGSELRGILYVCSYIWNQAAAYEVVLRICTS